MIIDHLRHLATYQKVHPGLAAGLEFLRTLNFDALQPGRNEIDGDRIFAMKQEYDSRPPELGKWEAHRKYADIQLVVCGEEQMGYAPLEALTVTEPYDESRDVAFFEGRGDFIRLGAGQFAIFLPQDVHMPGIALGAPAPVKKVVVKVAL